MSDSQNMINLSDDGQHWLDRLADGELNADEQRQLLLALETQPDAWRRCALAFIEAQTLRGEFRQLMPNENAASRSSVTTVAAARSLRQQKVMLSRLNLLALAAGVLVAFSLGLAARGWLGGLSFQQTGQIAATKSPQSTQAPAEKTLAANQPAVKETQAYADTGNAANSTVTSRKWQALKVTLPAADGQGEQTVEVPLVAGSDEEVQTLLAKQEPVLSDAALKTLQSTGHEVEQHRAYYPVQLEDGTQAVLPMDFVEVRDTGNWQ
jgi:uncharacterized lipoprotein NlpE involved in copper resistance